MSHAGAGGTAANGGAGGTVTSGTAGSVGTAGTGGSVATTGGAGGTSAGGMTSTGGSVGTAGSSSAGAGGSGPTSRPKIRTVGYLPDYRGALSTWAGMDWSMVSYVDLAFAAVNDAGDISYKDPAIPAFTTAAHNAGAKVCMAFGGSSTINSLGSLGNLIAPAGRAGFIQKITAFASTNGLDCIDIDFEGNGVNGDYEGFVTALATALHAQNKELSAAVGQWFGNNFTAGALAAFDFLNVMAYDFHNPYPSTTPLQSSSIPDAQAELDYWSNSRGMDKKKLNFGVPFYGLKWTGAAPPTALTWGQLIAAYPAAATMDEIQQDGATVYLNSKATIQAKTKTAEASYGGIMVWELGQDASGGNSLLHAIHDAL